MTSESSLWRKQTPARKAVGLLPDRKDLKELQLIASRIVPFIDSDMLEERNAREALFRDGDGEFVLYLSRSLGSAGAEERLIRLDPRNALVWINENTETHGSFWE